MYRTSSPDKIELACWGSALMKLESYTCVIVNTQSQEVSILNSTKEGLCRPSKAMDLLEFLTIGTAIASSSLNVLFLKNWWTQKKGYIYLGLWLGVAVLSLGSTKFNSIQFKCQKCQSCLHGSRVCTQRWETFLHFKGNAYLSNFLCHDASAWQSSLLTKIVRLRLKLC